MAANETSTTCSPSNTLVLSDSEQASAMLHTQLEIVVYLCTVIAIFIVGLVTNGTFLFTMSRVPRTMTTVNIYLANLAIADIMFLLTTTIYIVSIFSYSSIRENVPFPGTISCISIYGAISLSYYASLGIVSIVSLDRFLAITHPLRHRYMKSKTRSIKLVSTVWVVSIGLAAASSYDVANKVFCIEWPLENYEQHPQTMNICTAVDSKHTYNLLQSALAVATFFIPMTFNSILYTRIIMALSGEKRSVRSSSSMTTSIRNQVARTLVITGILFFVLQVPFRIYNIGSIISSVIGESVLQEPLLLIVGRFLMMINSAINSIVYVFTSSHYRNSFRLALGLRNITARTQNDVRLGTVPNTQGISNQQSRL